MAAFKKETGDWKRYRRLGPQLEIDFHHEDGRREIPYEDAMASVLVEAMDALKTASKQGLSYVLLTHGCSTSRPGNTTARSQVRSLMRSPDATPYIIRSQCIQHESVFVAAIRQNSGGSATGV